MYEKPDSIRIPIAPKQGDAALEFVSSTVSNIFNNYTEGEGAEIVLQIRKEFIARLEDQIKNLENDRMQVEQGIERRHMLIKATIAQL